MNENYPFLQRIDDRKAQIEAFGEWDSNLKQKIDFKFRLDWNYHSNSMEGGTLTFRETRTLMVGNISVHGKPIKDVMEMKKHDDLVKEVMSVAHGEKRLSETRIKAIHAAIMHEEDPEKAKLIGAWKTRDNEIINPQGEKFLFTKSPDVPDAIHGLLNRLNANWDLLERGSPGAAHPVLMAFDFHLEYLTIHPFYDGNGRTARILLNLILIAFGYPPLIVRKEEKDRYGKLLADIQGYGALRDDYYSFMASLVLRSQDLVLKALGGEEIDEPEDLDKKIELMEMELQTFAPDSEVKVRFNRKTLIEAYDNWIGALLSAVLSQGKKFDKFFVFQEHVAQFYSGERSSFFVGDLPVSSFVQNLRNALNAEGQRFQPHNSTLEFYLHHRTFEKSGIESFDSHFGFWIDFHINHLQVFVHLLDEEGNRTPSNVPFVEMQYHHSLGKNKIDEIALLIANSIYEFIDHQTKNRGIR